MPSTVASLAESLARMVGDDTRPAVSGAADTIARQSRYLIDFVERYRAIARNSGRIAAESTDGVPDHGWFVAPTVAADLPADSPVQDSLRLAGVTIPPSRGEMHRARCLEALALFQASP